MNGKRVEVDLATLGKAFAVFVLLLILSFVLGIFLGRESGSSSPSAAPAEGTSEELAACTYKVQELSAKLTALTTVAQEKGIIDQNGVPARNMVCAPAVPPEPPKPAAAEERSAGAPSSEPRKEPPTPPTQIPAVAAGTKPPPCKYALQIYAGRTREEALDVQAKSKVKPTRLVTGTVDGVTWHRLRYGCYPDKATAEAAMSDLLPLGARAIIVKEEQP